jgi:hypothetical protein
VVLIVIGITPFLIRDLALRVGEMPSELLIKAQTLGASTWQIILRVVLPQIAPGWPTLRLSLGAGLAVPDLGRGHRRHRRAGLPHLPDAALSGDGCDPALCRLDHLARLH